MAASPKVSIDKTEAQFLADEATYLEAVVSQEIITPGSQNVETGLLQTIQGRLTTAFFNVFEFGVVGSGDDTTAMQLAFTTGGVAVYYIPPGTYTLTLDIVVSAGSVVIAPGVTLTGGRIINPGNVTIIGLNVPIDINIEDVVPLNADGSTEDALSISTAISLVPDGSIIRFNGKAAYRAIDPISIPGRNDLILDGGGALMIIDAGFFLTGTCNRITFRNFRFDGSNDPASSRPVSSASGTFTDIRVENIIATECANCVQFKETDAALINSLVVEGCRFDNTARAEGAIDLSRSTGEIHNIILTKNQITNSLLGPAIRLKGIDGFVIEHNLISGTVTGDGAIYLDDASRGTISGTLVMECERECIQVVGTSNRIAIGGNVFEQEGSAIGPAIDIAAGLVGIVQSSNQVNGGGLEGSRSGAATPISSVVPHYIGEEFLETTTPQWFKSTGLTSADWVGL